MAVLFFLDKIIMRFLLVVLSLSLFACASSSSQPSGEPESQLVTCEPEVVIKERRIVLNRIPLEATRDLSIGFTAFKVGDFDLARKAFEAVLAEENGLQSDSFALWGMINLFLDRSYKQYSRDEAKTVLSVFKQKLDQAIYESAAIGRSAPIEEARLLSNAMDVLFKADESKDNVVAENQRLREELANKEQALKRLRELTVGQE